MMLLRTCLIMNVSLTMDFVPNFRFQEFVDNITEIISTRTEIEIIIVTWSHSIEADLYVILAEVNNVQFDYHLLVDIDYNRKTERFYHKLAHSCNWLESNGVEFNSPLQ